MNTSTFLFSRTGTTSLLKRLRISVKNDRKSTYKNILRLVVKKSPTGESTHYFFHSQDDKVEVSC